MVNQKCAESFRKNPVCRSANLFLLCLAGFVFAGCAHFEPKPLSASATAEYLEGRSLGDTNFKTFLERNLGRPVAEWPLTHLDFSSLTLAAFYFHPDLD